MELARKANVFGDDPQNVYFHPLPQQCYSAASVRTSFSRGLPKKSSVAVTFIATIYFRITTEKKIREIEVFKAP